MEITVPNIIVSILNINDDKYVISKLKELEQQLNLNDVEQRIILEIYESVNIGSIISPTFIRKKYSYVFEDDILEQYLPQDAIDSAITQVKISQAKTSLKLNLLDISSNLDSLDPLELKDKVASLLENELLITKTEDIPDILVPSEDAYKDVIAGADGLSLVDRRIESYAGKATPSTVTTILAFAGSFKSTFALNIAYLNALDGYNIVYLSLESTAAKLKQRLVLNHIASTTTDRNELIQAKWVRDKQLTEPLQKVYNRYHNDLMDKLGGRLILWDEEDIQYNTFLEMNHTLQKADKIFKERNGKGVEAIILDQLALLKNTRAGGRKYTYDGAVLNDWMTYFRKQALNFLDTGRETTVFVVSQINRESFTEASKPRNKGRYDMTAASDSNEIERASNTMITLFKDLETQNTLLVNIPKAREGDMPDNPLQLEVYGDYAHIGPLKAGNLTLEDLELEAETFSLESLIND